MICEYASSATSGYRLADLAKPSRIVALRPAGCTAPLRCTLVPAASSATGSAVGSRPGPSRCAGTGKRPLAQRNPLQTKKRRTLPVGNVLLRVRLRTRLVGVTRVGFANSLEHSATHRRRMVEPRAKHCFASVSPCFGRRNFEKTAHRAVFSLFPLDPSRWFGTNKRPWVQIKPLQTKKRKAHPADTLFSFWSE